MSKGASTAPFEHPPGSVAAAKPPLEIALERVGGPCALERLDTMRHGQIVSEASRRRSLSVAVHSASAESSVAS